MINLRCVAPNHFSLPQNHETTQGMTSSTESKSSNRIRLLTAIAVLAGAVVLLIVTEVASLPSKETQAVESTGPAASATHPDSTR
mgnify:CR=1 FL=1